MTKENSREVWIDWLRVAACFMVFVVHSTEPFYLGGEGSLILTETDALWTSFFDSFVHHSIELSPVPGKAEHIRILQPQSCQNPHTVRILDHRICFRVGRTGRELQQPAS